MSKKVNTKKNINDLLSDSDSEVQIAKPTKAKEDKTTKQRKASAASEESNSVNLLKNKKPEPKKGKQLVDSDSEDEVVTKKQVKKSPAKKVSKKKDDSDSESEEVKKPVKKASPKKQAKKAKADSDSESEEVKKPVKKASPKKQAKKVESDSEDEKPVKKASPKKQAKKAKADSDSESDKPVKKAVPVPKKAAAKDSDDESEEVPKKQEKAPVKKAAAKDSDDDESSEVVVKKPEVKKPVTSGNDDGETHSELFVRNLSYEVTEDSLYEHFGKFGTVTNVKVLYNKQTGKPSGLAFVAFESRAEAKKALENCGDVNGRTPGLSFSNEKKENNNNFNNNANNNAGGFKRPNFSGEAHTVFVGNLSFKTNEGSISKFFSKAGTVVGVRIAKHEDGKMKGFGHVDFDSQDAAQAALKLAGQSLDGREIRVDVSQPRKSGGGFGGDRPSAGGFRGKPSSKPSHGAMGASGNKVTFNDSDDE